MPGRARDRARSRRGVSGSVLAEFDFTTQSAGAASLPSGLTFARASSGYTVQTGTSTLTTTGVTSDNVARVGKLADAHSNGIFIEPARTNLYGYSRSANLASGTAGHSCTYTTGRTGPDGGTSAIRGQTPSGGYSRFQTLAPVTGNHTLSTWAAAGLGSGAYQVVGAYTGTTGAAVRGTASAAWGRVASAAFDYPAASSPTVNPWDGRANATLGSSAGARDCDLDFVQFEAGKYATSAIVTSGGSTATRAAEILTVNGAVTSPVARQGRLGCYLRFRAIAARSALTAASEGNLFTDADGDWYVWVNGSNGLVEIGKGDTSKLSASASNAITWSAGDLVEIAAQFGNGKSRLRYRINVGTATDISFSAQDDTFGALAAANGIYVCSDGTTYHTPSVVEKVVLYLPGRSVF